MDGNDLERLMNVKQATKKVADNWEALAEYLGVMATLRRQYYLCCVQAGFTAQEALALASAFQLPTGTTGA